ncbi:MAG: UDP-N-acetylmuramate dehydrogenase [Actinomycetes bacterium]
MTGDGPSSGDLSVPADGMLRQPLVHGVPLAPLTTLRVGGPASTLVHAATDADLVAAVVDCDRVGEPVLLLGGGSNVVVGDAGFDGTVVRVATQGVSVTRDGGEIRVVASAGEVWDRLVARAAGDEWSGIEALSGIPGLVGATPIQNVGAYGREVADVLDSVTAFDRRSREITTLTAGECGFGYRSSRFKSESGRWVILAATLRLASDPQSAPVRYAELADRLGIAVGERAALAQVRRAVLAVRRSKGMVLDIQDHDTWSVGSFFTNPTVPSSAAQTLPPECPRWPVDGVGTAEPGGTSVQSSVKLSAAWLIGYAGFERGYPNDSRERAGLSTKHSLAITNRGGATAAEVLSLARTIRDAVLTLTGVTLVAEPNFVNVAAL